MSTDFLAHGGTLTLAWFVAVNAFVCLLTAIALRISQRSDARGSAGLWMAIRLAPSAVSAMFVAALFVPSYWKYEPREAVEGFDVTLTLVALAGAGVLAVGAVRGLRGWLTARRRVADWMARAEPIALPSAALPAYAVDSDQPFIALAGIFRPRLLITRGLLATLTAAELDAAIAHEMGHRRSFDNLKRLLMCAAPDLLAYSTAARTVERRWAAAAERIADRISGPNAAAARCALASALVKVARLTPAPVGNAEPISALISGGEIASRVQSLLDDDEAVAPNRRPWARRLAAVLAVTVMLAVAYAPLLRSVHEVTEMLVRSLP